MVGGGVGGVRHRRAPLPLPRPRCNCLCVWVVLAVHAVLVLVLVHPCSSFPPHEQWLVAVVQGGGGGFL